MSAGADSSSPSRPPLAQAILKLSHRFYGSLIVRLKRIIQADMCNDTQAAAQMVKDQHRFGKEKVRFRQCQGISFGDRQALEAGNRFIAQVANRAAMKARQPRQPPASSAPVPLQSAAADRRR